MKLFKFVGDADGDGPETIELFGLSFEKDGSARQVDDARAIEKLAGNSHFVEVKRGRKKDGDDGD